MTTLVDTNVLLDIASNDPDWSDWSLLQVQEAARRGRVFIDPVIYAELSVRYERADDVDEMLTQTGVEMIEPPRAALFLAGKVFQQYRRRGGPRTGVLPDFFIGAHASVAGIPLLTRDTKRYRTYFSDVELIAPYQ